MSFQKIPELAGGPQPFEPEIRRERAAEIVEVFRRHYGEAVMAIGYYGSLAKGTDGPYSDIEMQCVISDTGVERTFEWNAGAWKAEVNVQSRDVLLSSAATIEGDWSITHGAYSHILPVYDPDRFFDELSQVAHSQSLRRARSGNPSMRKGSWKRGRRTSSDCAGLFSVTRIGPSKQRKGEKKRLFDALPQLVS